MIRLSKRTLLLLAFVSLPCAAFSKVLEIPKDKPKWRVGVTAPSFYPVYVNKVYGVNEKEDWTSIMFSYSQLSNRISLNKIQQWFPYYDGFGIALDTLTGIFSAQVGGTNHLPDSVYIHWTSMHDLNFYVTKFTLSPQIKNIMLKENEWSWGRPCYVNDFMFGLLPNGHAKVWLSGCETFIYIGDIAPFKITLQDYEGRKSSELTSAPQYFKTIEKQANDLGQYLDPIPWDKINKVYWNKDKFISLDKLNDYNDQGELINPRPDPVAPKPEKITYRCWADKPPAPKTPLKIDDTSPAHIFQQTLWEYSPNLVNPVRDLDSTMNDAWNEATQQKLDEDHTQAWVLARLVGLTDYPLDKLYKELKIPTYGQRYIEGYLEQMCQSQ